MPDLYPLIRSPIRPLELVKGRIPIVGFIRSPTTLAVYDVVHSFLLGGTDRDFPVTEDETRRNISHFSGTSREQTFTLILTMNNNLSSHLIYIINTLRPNSRERERERETDRNGVGIGVQEEDDSTIVN